VTPDFSVANVRELSAEVTGWSDKRKFKKVIESTELLMHELRRNGHPNLKDGTKIESAKQYWATWNSEFSCKVGVFLIPKVRMC